MGQEWMMDFWKDVIAMFLGMVLGALLVRQGGLWWMIFGAATGGAIGYGARLAAEPARARWAFFSAWRAVIGWRPKFDWKERCIAGSKMGFSCGSMFGEVIAVALLFGSFFEGAYILGFIAYVVALAGLTAIGSVVGTVVTYLGKRRVKNSERDEAEFLFKFNAYAMHFYAARCAVRGIMTSPTWLPRVVSSLPRVCMPILRFLALFAKKVHSSAFVACALWAMGGAVAIGLTFSGPLQIILASVSGALVGALMRSILFEVVSEEGSV